MNALSLMLAGMAATAAPVEETGPTARLGQENPPAIVPAGADPIYPAESFAPFQPQTALDMLERTPGFVLSEDTSLRGFGNGAGNVLIDGCCAASPCPASNEWSWRDHARWGGHVETTAFAGFKTTLRTEVVTGQNNARSRRF